MEKRRDKTKEIQGEERRVHKTEMITVLKTSTQSQVSVTFQRRNIYSLCINVCTHILKQ